MTLPRRAYGAQIVFSLVAKAAYFLVLVMLYKSVSASEAGRFTVIFALGSILATLAECGTRGLMIREMARVHESPPESQRLLSSAMMARWLSLPIHLGVGLAAAILFIPEAPLALAAIMLTALWLDSVSLIVRGSLRAFDYIKLEAVLSAFPRCLLLLTTTALYLAHQLTVQSLAAAWLCASLLDAVLTCYFVVTKTGLRPWMTSRLTSSAHMLRRAIPFALLTVIGIVYLRTALIILSATARDGLTEAAALGLAARLPEGLSFIPIAIMNTAITYLARHHATEPMKLRPVFNQVERLIGSAGILATVGIVAFPELWIRFVASSVYEPYTTVFQLYGLTVVLSFLQYLLSNILLSMNHERLVAGRHAAILLANIIWNLIIAPKWGALGCVGVLLACETAAVAIDLTMLSRHGYRLSPENLRLFVGIAIISMAFAYYCRNLPDFYPVLMYGIGAGLLFLAVFYTSGKANTTA